MTYCYNCMSKMNDEGKCGKCGFSQEYYEIQPHQLMPGYKLRDRYVVGKVLGEGGFGITYIGMDEFFDEKVAIKEFYMTGFVNRNNTYSAKVSAETGDKGELFIRNREKFYDEAKVLVKLGREDGIVKVRDFFYENETAYIVMDYLEGKTLKDLLKERKTLSVEETLQMFNPILNALSKVHEQNIIHRDISPDNIIITEDGKPWLIDFGAAREFADDDIKSLSVILKPGYAPEEQYRRRGVQGPWTDIYAICATMYRCIGGKRPDDALERLAEDETEELCTIAPACPKHLSDVIMKGLSVRQKERYQSIEDLRADLEKEVTEPVYATQEPEPVLDTADAGNNMADEETVMIFATPSPEAKQIVEPVEEVVPVEYATAEPEIIEEPVVYAEPVETEDNTADEPTEMIFATERPVTVKPEPEIEVTPTTKNDIKPIEKSENKEESNNNKKSDIHTKGSYKNKKKKKKIWLIPVAILGVGILVAVYFIFFFTKPATSKNADVGKASVGDIIKFGSYEQDGNTSNGAEPIEWEVLSKENGKALLISKYVLDCQPYNTKETGLTWKNSSLRKWMNKDFFNTAFDKSEKAQIVEVKLDNPDNPYLGTKGGNSTKDRIFALSLDEIHKYYSFDYWDDIVSKDLIIDATTYAENEGVDAATMTEGVYHEFFCEYYSTDVIGLRGSQWWLRTPGFEEDSVCYVMNIMYWGGHMNAKVSYSEGVRPALYVAY